MLGEQGGNSSEVSRVEMKRRGRIKIEGAQTIFLFVWRKNKNKQKIEPVQNICTGSEKIVPKAKIELQHIYVGHKVLDMYKCFMGAFSWLMPHFCVDCHKHLRNCVSSRSSRVNPCTWAVLVCVLHKPNLSWKDPRSNRKRLNWKMFHSRL